MNCGPQSFRDLCPQRGNYFTVPFLLLVSVVAVACHLCSLNVNVLAAKYVRSLDFSPPIEFTWKS